MGSIVTPMSDSMASPERQDEPHQEFAKTACFLVLLAFGAAFLALGVHAGLEEGSQALAADDSKALLLAVVGGLAFAGFGAGSIALGAYVRFGTSPAERRRRQHPEEPWRWRADWASGCIRHRAWGKAVLALILGIAVTGATTSLLWRVPERVGNGESAFLYLALALPAAGAGLLVWALVLTRRARRFGDSVLELETNPGVIGGRFTGVLRIGAPLPAAGVAFTLQCFERPRHGSHSDNGWLRFQERLVVEEERLYFDGRTTGVPFGFTLPYECLSSNASDTGSEIRWQLDASAGVAGVDYAASFEVPIFRTAESSAEITGDGAATVAASSTFRFDGRDSRHSGIRVRPWGNGGLEFVFGAARNPRIAACITGVTAAAAFGLHLLAARELPTLLLAGGGVLTGLLALSTICLWLGVTRVRAEYGRILVTRGPLGLGPTRAHPLQEIRRIHVRNGTVWAGRLFYDIRIERDVPRKHPKARTLTRRYAAGSRLRTRADAEALATEMSKLVAG